MYTTLISKEELSKNLDNPHFVIIDCRFSLADPMEGWSLHKASHIPRAQYANLDTDLSSPFIKGKTGRHPLPEVKEITQKIEEYGIDNSSQVIIYDQSHGGIAARLWWLLKWLGHEKVAVLDGGWKAWVEANLSTSNESFIPKKGHFEPTLLINAQVDINFVDTIRNDENYCLIDSRTAARYRGEIEPIDPIAGHIPGAISAPFPENLDENGHFLSKEKLRERFENLKGKISSDKIVFYCGSGVTACHNLLAYEHAGLGRAKLFVGSWSGWIADGKREIA